MNKNIKKVSAIALCATIACSGLGNCGYAQWDEDDSFNIASAGLNNMPENNDPAVSTPLSARVPGTPGDDRHSDRGPVTPARVLNFDDMLAVPPAPVADRHSNMEPFTPMRLINFDDDMLAVPPAPVADRQLVRGPLTPVHFPTLNEVLIIPQTPVANRRNPMGIFSPVPFSGFGSAL